MNKIIQWMIILILVSFLIILDKQTNDIKELKIRVTELETQQTKMKQIQSLTWDSLMTWDEQVENIYENYTKPSHTYYDGDWDTYGNNTYEEYDNLSNKTIKKYQEAIWWNNLISLCPENTTLKEVTCDCAKNTKYPCMAYCFECIKDKG